MLPLLSSLPRCLREAPALDGALTAPAPTPKYALLINPFYRRDPHGSYGKHVLTPSLALTSLAAATPADWQVRYWDENLLQGPPPSSPFPAVVGISVHLTFARRAYELARWYRQRGAKVVLGGLHVLSCPDEAAPHADALALGEGVQLWPQILHDFEQGCLQPRYAGDYSQPFGDDPLPRRELLPRDSFLTTASLMATRGCHNRCDFCSMSTDELRMPYQTRDPQRVAAEFRASGQRYGVFLDNNLGSDRHYLQALCRALRPLERIWSAAITLDVTDDPALVREMALAGCTGVFVGFETLTLQNLVQARKRTAKPEDFARRVKIFQRYGIQVNGSFVFGFDDDGPEVFKQTVEWIEASKLECATFHILTPYPGTPLFKKLKREGRLRHMDWSLYDTAHVVFRPASMSEEQLLAGYRWCYRRLFSLRSIWRRRPLRHAEVLPFVAMNLLYKRSNWLWPFIIRHRLTQRFWQPLVNAALTRHLVFRKKLTQEDEVEPLACALPAPAGV